MKLHIFKNLIALYFCYITLVSLNHEKSCEQVFVFSSVMKWNMKSEGSKCRKQTLVLIEQKVLFI